MNNYSQNRNSRKPVFTKLQIVANIIHISVIRKYILFSLVIIIPLGFLLKFYEGMFQNWVQNSAAGMAYEIFWCLLFFYFFPARRFIFRIAAGVFIGTSLLEFTQLLHPPLLEAVRSSFPGRTLFGTTFSYLDFPHYLAGCILGGIWLQVLLKITEKRTTFSENQPE